MDMETYESLLLKWKESTSSKEKMQEWVENVQCVIGKRIYESIKRDFLDIEEENKKRVGSMNCIQPFKNEITVHFKKDIGAELTTVHDFDTFRMYFSNILGGLVDTEIDTSICMGT